MQKNILCLYIHLYVCIYVLCTAQHTLKGNLYDGVNVHIAHTQMICILHFACNTLNYIVFNLFRLQAVACHMCNNVNAYTYSIVLYNTEAILFFQTTYECV